MSKGIFQIEGLAGFRIDVVGYSHLEGYQMVTSIVADSPAEAEAELTKLLADEDFADWQELYSVPNGAWESTFLRDATESNGIRLR